MTIWSMKSEQQKKGIVALRNGFGGRTTARVSLRGTSSFRGSYYCYLLLLLLFNFIEGRTSKFICGSISSTRDGIQTRAHCGLRLNSVGRDREDLLAAFVSFGSDWASACPTP